MVRLLGILGSCDDGAEELAGGENKGMTLESCAMAESLAPRLTAYDEASTMEVGEASNFFVAFAPCDVSTGRFSDMVAALIPCELLIKALVGTFIVLVILDGECTVEVGAAFSEVVAFPANDAFVENFARNELVPFAVPDDTSTEMPLDATLVLTSCDD